MRILVACEFSGVVREAFRRRGHDAWSLDLLPAEDKSEFHYYDYDLSIGIKTDEMLRHDYYGRWDMLLAFPPCTYLCNSGVRWLYLNGKGHVKDAERWMQMESAARFFRMLWNCPIPRIAIENPKMHPYAARLIGQVHSQVIHPWQFGHGETKETRLWLKNLPLLQPTKIVKGRNPRVHYASPGPNRWKERSRTLQGIADAMAEQWGSIPVTNAG